MPKGLRVLVADDDRDNAHSLTRALSLLGHEVRTALGGAAALGEATGWVPDAVILGLEDPELARRLRKHPSTSGALLVCLSCSGTAADRERSLAAGCDHHLLKPAALGELRRLLEARSSGA